MASPTARRRNISKKLRVAKLIEIFQSAAEGMRILQVFGKINF
jgi:hypothetical protein